MATKTLKNKLAMAKKLFKKAKESAKEGGYGNNIEDGRYKAKITGAEGPLEAQTSGRLQAVLSYKILDGEFKGESIKSFPNLENEVGLSILIRDLNKLGYEVEDFDDIEQALEELNEEAPNVRITVKTKNEFQNVSIDKLLDKDDVEEEEEDDDDSDSDGEAEPEEEEEAESEAEEEEEEEVEEEPEEEPEVEEEVEEEEEELELEEGSSVGIKIKGEKMNGTILEIVDEETVRVKADNGKTYKLNVEKLFPAEEEKKPAKKKAAKKEAPAKKKKK